MPISLACLMAITTALLTVAVCAVRWRMHGLSFFGPAPFKEASVPKNFTPCTEGRSPENPVYTQPEGSLLAGQLEVGQTFHVQTRTAKYVLTLRDPVIGMYEAVRIGPKDGKIRQDRFQMLFKGTFVLGHGIRFGEFVLGGQLCYRKIRGDDILDVSPSSQILRVLFVITDSYQQAS